MSVIVANDSLAQLLAPAFDGMNLDYQSSVNAGIVAIRLIKQTGDRVSSDLLGLLLAIYAFKSALKSESFGREAVLDAQAEIERFLGRSARALLNHPDAEYSAFCRSLLEASGLDLEVLAELGAEEKDWSSTSC